MWGVYFNLYFSKSSVKTTGNKVNQYMLVAIISDGFLKLFITEELGQISK